jgi:hypothetical protein
MFKFKIAALAVVAMSLSGCLDSDAERGLAGAAAGAVVADATENDVLTGALIGGAGGVFCDDINLCPPAR